MERSLSILSDSLINAYKNTNFEVLAKSPFILNVGKYSSKLELLFDECSKNQGCFITAYNPLSEPTLKEENEIAQQKLKDSLLSQNLSFLNGIGSDPSGEWQGEPSFFVLGLSKEKSEGLGSEYRQNAIVWSDHQCIPELILLR